MCENGEITLTEDQRAVLTQQVKDASHALGALLMISHGEQLGLDRELAENALCVAEYRLGDIGKLLGVSTDSAERVEQRHADLRQANLRIRALEQELGGTVSPDAVQLALRAMSDRLNAWWDLEGFGYIPSVEFGAHGCQITFSCSLFGDFCITGSSTPVSDKERRSQWHASLAERGFRLVRDSRDWALEDCDANRKLICDLFAERLPSAAVSRFESIRRSDANGFVLREVDVFVRKIAEIPELPGKIEGLEHGQTEKAEGG